MASRIVDRGLQQALERVSGISAAPPIQTMSVDSRTTAFVAGDTNLGNPTSEFDAAFDATPVRTGQTVRHLMTVPSGTAIDIKRVALHNDTPANVTPTSNTLMAGIDNQSFNKPAGFAVQITVDIAYSAL